MPNEDFTDETLAIDDTYGDDAGQQSPARYLDLEKSREILL